MSQQNPVRLFVTHAWQQPDDYLRLFEFLESARNFYYRNTSTPEQPPGGDSERQREDLRRQISAAEITIALPGLYSEQPDLLIFQMNFAQSQKKPVLLLKPFGSSVPVNKLLIDRASEVAEWDERGLVDAIRRLARHEGTSRYETIEFNAEDFKDYTRKSGPEQG
jgi:hypothetical protein